MHRTLRLPISLVLLLVLQAGRAQDHVLAHGIGGALLPSRATLMRIPSEVWKGLPNGPRPPASVDLRPWLPPPGDQGHQNACVAFALAYGLKSFQETTQHGTHTVFSPTFAYNLSKAEFDSTDATCMGSNFDKVLSILVEQGCCTWDQLPYDTSSTACFHPVPPTLFQAAAPHTLASPMRVAPGNTEQLRYHLAQRTPVAFAMGIDTAFKYGGLRAGRAGKPFRWVPACAASMPGSHAMLVVGYNDADSTFLVMNSWGTTWGEGGFCRIRYDVFDCHVTEAYVAFDALEGRAAAQTHVVDDKGAEDRVRIKVRVGEAMVVHDLEIGLLLASTDGDRVRVTVNDGQDEGPSNTLDLHRDHTVQVQRGGDLVVVDYVRRSWFKRQRNKRAHIAVRVLHDTRDANVERTLVRAERISSARRALLNAR